MKSLRFRSVRPSCSCGQILLPRYLMDDLSNVYEAYMHAPTDDLVRFWRSKVKVIAGRRGGEGINVDARGPSFNSKITGVECRPTILGFYSTSMDRCSMHQQFCCWRSTRAPFREFCLFVCLSCFMCVSAFMAK